MIPIILDVRINNLKNSNNRNWFINNLNISGDDNFDNSLTIDNESQLTIRAEGDIMVTGAIVVKEKSTLRISSKGKVVINSLTMEQGSNLEIYCNDITLDNQIGIPARCNVKLQKYKDI